MFLCGGGGWGVVGRVMWGGGVGWVGMGVGWVLGWGGVFLIFFCILFVCVVCVVFLGCFVFLVLCFVFGFFFVFCLFPDD